MERLKQMASQHVKGELPPSLVRHPAYPKAAAAEADCALQDAYATETSTEGTETSTEGTEISAENPEVVKGPFDPDAPVVKMETHVGDAFETTDLDTIQSLCQANGGVSRRASIMPEEIFGAPPSSSSSGCSTPVEPRAVNPGVARLRTNSMRLTDDESSTNQSNINRI